MAVKVWWRSCQKHWLDLSDFVKWLGQGDVGKLIKVQGHRSKEAFLDLSGKKHCRGLAKIFFKVFLSVPFCLCLKAKFHIVKILEKSIAQIQLHMYMSLSWCQDWFIMVQSSEKKCHHGYKWMVVMTFPNTYVELSNDEDSIVSHVRKIATCCVYSI